MNHYNHQNQSAVADQTSKGPYVVAPPPAGYPMKDGQAYTHHNYPPVQTKSKGDGFWKGCCAALCCCCMLDACF